MTKLEKELIYVVRSQNKEIERLIDNILKRIEEEHFGNTKCPKEDLVKPPENGNWTCFVPHCDCLKVNTPYGGAFTGNKTTDEIECFTTLIEEREKEENC